MTDTPTMSPAGRATVVFVAEPSPALQCSHCGSEVTDDDADCPRCTTPLDWGASRQALAAWHESGAA
jgi:predicted amidophosphoribosyltransferase